MTKPLVGLHLHLSMTDHDPIESFLRDVRRNSAPEKDSKWELDLIRQLVNESYNLKTAKPEASLGRILAAAFDLAVSAAYYRYVSQRGWFYCPSPSPRLYFHFTNCCPRHALDNSFYFNKSNKPESANIGEVTSRILRRFISVLFEKNNVKAQVLKGKEPIDIVILEDAGQNLFFGEVKAAPLLTLPLAKDAEPFKDEEGNLLKDHDAPVAVSPIYKTPIKLFVPKRDDNSKWTEHLFTLGSIENEDDSFWGYRSLLSLLSSDKTFFSTFFDFWDNALTFYHPKRKQSIFWLTNGSGEPNPAPPHWPSRKGGNGKNPESVSDSKTSVGMDRTDDIKKGIYQILKIGVENKPSKSKWKLRLGIISNIHAARHFEEYLSSLQNLVWTLDETGKAQKASDLDDNHPLYNLFDGIITFTQSHIRDPWLKSIFDFEAKWKIQN